MGEEVGVELVAVSRILYRVLPREVCVEGLSFAEAIDPLDLIGSLTEEAPAKRLDPP